MALSGSKLPCSHVVRPGWTARGRARGVARRPADESANTGAARPASRRPNRLLPRPIRYAVDARIRRSAMVVGKLGTPRQRFRTNGIETFDASVYNAPWQRRPSSKCRSWPLSACAAAGARHSWSSASHSLSSAPWSGSRGIRIRRRQGCRASCRPPFVPTLRHRCRPARRRPIPRLTWVHDVRSRSSLGANGLGSIFLPADSAFVHCIYGPAKGGNRPLKSIVVGAPTIMSGPSAGRESSAASTIGRRSRRTRSRASSAPNGDSCTAGDAQSSPLDQRRHDLRSPVQLKAMTQATCPAALCCAWR